MSYSYEYYDSFVLAYPATVRGTPPVRLNSSDGFIHVDCVINGHPIDFLFDTGSQVSAIKRTDADRLEVTGGKKIGTGSVSGPDGRPQPTETYETTIIVAGVPVVSSLVVQEALVKNLLCLKDLMSAYDVQITNGQPVLTAKGGEGSPNRATIPTPAHVVGLV